MNDAIRLFVTRNEMGLEMLWAIGAGRERGVWPAMTTAADDQELAEGREVIAYAHEGRLMTERARAQYESMRPCRTR